MLERRKTRYNACHSPTPCTYKDLCSFSISLSLCGALFLSLMQWPTTHGTQNLADSKENIACGISC